MNLISKHLEFQTKTGIPPHVVFSTLFSVFGNRMKHCLSCLIHYLNALYRCRSKIYVGLSIIGKSTAFVITVPVFTNCNSYKVYTIDLSWKSWNKVGTLARNMPDWRTVDASYATLHGAKRTDDELIMTCSQHIKAS